MKALCLAILFLIPMCFSWDWDTHQWFASQICNYYSCDCMSEIMNGSIAPDKDFKDTARHHFYSPSTCVNSSYYTCPKEFDDIAIQKMTSYLALASEPLDCGEWYNIGVASHYYLDSKVIWHQAKGENYDECHGPFEDKVGEYFKKGIVDFSVTRCGENVKGSNFSEYLKEFEDMLGYERKDNEDIIPVMITALIFVIIAVSAMWKHIRKRI